MNSILGFFADLLSALLSLAGQLATPSRQPEMELTGSLPRLVEPGRLQPEMNATAAKTRRFAGDKINQ